MTLKTTRKQQVCFRVLTDVSRNSEEISKVVEVTRNDQVSVNGLDASQVITDYSCGHEITCEKVVYHQLNKVYDDKLRVQFVCERLHDELHNITSTLEHQTFHMADMAVLFRTDRALQKYQRGITQMLLKDFSAGTQTVEELIVSNNMNSVVVDVVDNVNSFECPFVVVVVNVGGGGRSSDYNLCTRAHSKLVYIQTYGGHTSLPTSLHTTGGDFINWYEHNGHFHVPP